MLEAGRLSWVKDRPDLQLPGSGLLVESSADELRGGLGFRASDGCCELWGEVGSGSTDWAELVERVTAQARKGKYRSAQVSDSGSLLPALRAALVEAGFVGDPLERPLLCDAPDDLQPYLDWKGRVVRIAEGKGREAINARLYGRVADGFPSDGQFSEREVNVILRGLHLYEDPAGLRRELVDRGYLARTRDCRAYWKVENPEIIGRI